jgi:hypothetical protein
VHEAAQLQDDLRRADVEPFGWVINASLAASGTTDPVLRRRAILEAPLIDKVRKELAARTWIVPWQEPALPASAGDRKGSIWGLCGRGCPGSGLHRLDQSSD